MYAIFSVDQLIDNSFSIGRFISVTENGPGSKTYRCIDRHGATEADICVVLDASLWVRARRLKYECRCTSVGDDLAL